MIGSLRGKVLQLNGITGLIECAGVGYEVELSLKALQALHAGEEGFVYVYHVVREDASLLYGFADTDEKLLFTELIRIPGLGPRTAMAVLSTFSAPEFIAVVERNDAAAFKPVPGGAYLRDLFRYYGGYAGGAEGGKLERPSDSHARGGGKRADGNAVYGQQKSGGGRGRL